jgi:HD-like signal output (HDOD) protein
MCVVSISPERVLAIADTFPATRQVLLQLGSLLRDPSVDLERIVVPLKRDPSLTARLVRIANSAAYAQSEPVASVEDATSLIGFREVHRLVGSALLDQFSDEGLVNYGVSCQQFRENSLFTAILMEELAVGAKEDPGYCYTVGLLRSIGKVALDRLARGLPAGEIPVLDEETRTANWENSVFGISGNEAAVHILKAWRFPNELIAAISGHYAPDEGDPPMTHLLHLAAGMADLLGHGLPGESGYWQDSEDVFRKAGLEPKAANRIIDHALSTFDRLKRAAF